MQDICNLVLPTWTLPYLINGDMDNITDHELELCKKLENKYHAFSFEGEPYFSWRNDLDNLGGECLDVICLEIKKPLP